MTLAEAIQEARAIDGRAVADLLPPPEDMLRAFELVEYFADAVDERPALCTYIVESLR